MSQLAEIKLEDARFSSRMNWLSQLHFKLNAHILKGQYGLLIAYIYKIYKLYNSLEAHAV